MSTTVGPDPWAEQARREAAHRALRRRRRRRWLVPLVAAVVVGAAGIVAALVIRSGDRRDDAALVSTTTTTTTTTTATTIAATEPSAAAEPTIGPADLVAVDEVWLVDRGDGVFDWGVAVRTQPGAPSRRGVEVTVRLIADGGDVVESVTDTLGVIDADSPAALAGRLVDPAVDPARIEFDISVGEETQETALADLLDVRALARDGDELTGRIRSSAATELGGLGVRFVWHDDDGAVIGTASLEIEALRPGVDARFELDLSDEVVPDGRPDAVFWVR